MSVIEKELYKSIAEDLMLEKPYDDYIWGEDLYDLNIMVYSGGFGDISTFNLIKDDILKCGLFFYDRKKDYLRIEMVRIFEPTGDVYIGEKLFNSIWKSLRQSIKIGIDQAPKDAERVAETPEDTVCLDLLGDSIKTPKLTTNGIKYHTLQPSEEEKRLKSRRQSLMDNRDMIFCYSKQGGYVHDKYCPVVPLINDEDFMASAVMPDGVDKCHRCRMMMAVREACKPKPKQIAPICALFSRSGIGIKYVEKLIYEKGYRLFLNTPDELTIETKEDHWFVRIHSNGKLTIWHNNYSKISDTERYIRDGFHKQGDFGKSLQKVLEYIEGYSWEKFHVERVTAVNESEHMTVLEKKGSVFKKWIAGLWKRLTTIFRWNEKAV